MGLDKLALKVKVFLALLIITSIFFSVINAAFADKVIGATCSSGSTSNLDDIETCRVQTDLLIQISDFDNKLKESDESFKEKVFNYNVEYSTMNEYKQNINMIAGVLSIFIIIAAAILFIISSEDPTKRNQAKNMLYGIVLFVILLFGMPLIVSFFTTVGNQMAVMFYDKTTFDTNIRAPTDSLNLNSLYESSDVSQMKDTLSILSIYGGNYINASKAIVFAFTFRDLYMKLFYVISGLVVFFICFKPTRHYGLFFFGVFLTQLLLPAITFIIFNIINRLNLSNYKVGFSAIANSFWTICILDIALIILVTYASAFGGHKDVL